MHLSWKKRGNPCLSPQSLPPPGDETPIQWDTHSILTSTNVHWQIGTPARTYWHKYKPHLAVPSLNNVFYLSSVGNMSVKYLNSHLVLVKTSLV